MENINVTNLKRNFETIFDEVSQGSKAYCIRRRKSNVVLLSLQEYRQIIDQIESDAIRKRIVNEQDHCPV